MGKHIFSEGIIRGLEMQTGIKDKMQYKTLSFLEGLVVRERRHISTGYF